MMVAIGLAFVAVAALIVLISPFAGLVLYWAWFLVRPQEFIEGFGGTFPLERILALSAVASLFLHYKFLARRPFVRSVVTKRFLLFLSVNYLSLVTSVWASNTLELANNLGKLFVFYFIVINIAEDESRLRRLIWVYIGCMSWAAMATLQNYISNPYYAQGIQRAVSVTLTWSDPNATAINFVLAIPFIFALMANSGWIKRATLIGILVLLMAAIVLTGSRTGFLLMVTVLFLSAVFSKRRVLLVSAILLVAVCGWTFVPRQYQERYAGVFALDEGPKEQDDSAYLSAYGRIVGWKVAWMIFKDYPILGVGAGNFPVAFATMDYSYEGHKGWSQPHNLPGQVLSELGILGAASFAAFVLAIVQAVRSSGRVLLSTASSSPFLPLIVRGILINIFLLLVAGFSSHDLYRYNWYVCAALAVVTARCAQQACVAEGAQLTLDRFAHVSAGELNVPDTEVHNNADHARLHYRPIEPQAIAPVEESLSKN